MHETMDRIQQVSNERQQLWRKAGKNGLDTSEARRLQTIGDELAVLWDQYRREFAGDTRVRNSEFVQQYRAA